LLSNLLMSMCTGALTSFTLVSVSQFLSSWLPSTVTLVYYLWLISRTRRLLGGDLRKAEWRPLQLAKESRELWQDGAAAIRKARHWTPS